MAKPTKKKPKTTKKDQISTNDEPATQNQPAPYKKETITKEKKKSKLFIFSWCLIFAFFILMYNSVMDQYMTSYALKSALSHEYVYSNYVEKKMSPLDVVFSTVFYCILFSYVLVIWALSDSCSHHHSSSGGRVAAVPGARCARSPARPPAARPVSGARRVHVQECARGCRAAPRRFLPRRGWA